MPPRDRLSSTTRSAQRSPSRRGVRRATVRRAACDRATVRPSDRANECSLCDCDEAHITSRGDRVDRPTTVVWCAPTREKRLEASSQSAHTFSKRIRRPRRPRRPRRRPRRPRRRPRRRPCRRGRRSERESTGRDSHSLHLTEPFKPTHTLSPRRAPHPARHSATPRTQCELRNQFQLESPQKDDSESARWRPPTPMNGHIAKSREKTHLIRTKRAQIVL
jgi:hypothetical protein